MKAKKIISILLCAALIFGVMSVGATQVFAAECEHNFVAQSTSEPTYNSHGETTYQCSLCGRIKTDDYTTATTGYTWDFSTGSAESVNGDPKNALDYSSSAGIKEKVNNVNTTIAEPDANIGDMLVNDVLESHQTVLKMDHSVTLNSANDWTVEIRAKGYGNRAIKTVFSTDKTFSQNDSKFIYINGNGDMFLGKMGSLLTDSGKTVSASSNYTYYKVSQTAYNNSILAKGYENEDGRDFDITDYHIYQMKCIGGVFSTWVDGYKIGNLSMSEQTTSSTRSTNKNEIYTGGTGTHFDFSNMEMKWVGNGSTKAATYGLTGYVDYLGIYPGQRNHTVWDFAEVGTTADGNIVNSSGSVENELSFVKSADGTKTPASQFLENNTLHFAKQTTFKISEPVTLSSNNDWMVEFVAKGDSLMRSFLSQGVSISGAIYFYINDYGDLCIVKKGSYTPDDAQDALTADYAYYKVSNEKYNGSVLKTKKFKNGTEFKTSNYNTYQVRCKDGRFSFWLGNESGTYVEEIGDFALTEMSSTRGGNTGYTDTKHNDYGTPFDFSTIKVDYVGCGSNKYPYNQGFTGTAKSLAIYSDTCELDFSAGLDSATPVDPIVGYPGKSVTLPTPETEETCKEFLGWNTKIDGTGTMYQAGDNYVFSGLEQQTLYGIWKDAHDFGEPAWSWTGNDTDGYTAATATFTCSQCQTTETVDANVTTEEPDGKVVYTATAEFQNETYTDTKTVYTDGVGARLAGHTISLDGDIAVNFYMELSDEIANSNTAYMQFNIPNTSEEYKSQKVYVKDAEEKAGYYQFKCRVAAKNMKSQITAQIMDPENNKEGTPYTYSVNQYANYLLNNQVDNPTFQAAAPLVQAMIAYGDYSENYFSANEALDEINTVIPDGYALTSKNLPEGVSFTGATLSLKSQTSLSLYFKNENDEPITLSCDGREVKTEKINGEDVIRIRNIATAELNKPIKVKINNSDNYYVIYSPMAYCSKAQNSNSVKLRNSVKSLYNYWNEAYKYFVIPHSKQILLTNNLNWNNAYLYAWGNEGDLTGVFPGSLHYEIINSGYYNETQFKFYVPEDATGIVISNGEGAQTVDITDFNNYDGYWLPGGMDNAGHYNVNGFNL